MDGSQDFDHMFDKDLARNAANYVSLTPTSLLRRAAEVFPDRTAVIHGDRRYDYRSLWARSRRLASRLGEMGVTRRDTVSIIAPNIPAMIEAHYAVPIVGAVLNPINIRLDAETVAFILRHSEAKVLLVDTEFGEVAKEAVGRLGRPIAVIDIDDTGNGRRIGEIEYEELIAGGDPEFGWSVPDDEWDPILLSYTSGTTGDPKGVVYHHRGAYLNALANVAVWRMTGTPVYLWTLPIFHSLGWCLPWTIPLMGGIQICLRKVDAGLIFDLIRRHRVSHMAGAPIVLQTLIEAAAAGEPAVEGPVHVMTAASPPPVSVIERIERLGFEILHVYGLTEVFGPAVVCEPQDRWKELSVEERAKIKARQGVAYPTVEALGVLDPHTMRPVPSDGATMGEVMVRSNTVMKGYLKNPAATAAAFGHGWFHTGDIAVMHPDGYIELKDRSKDVIISGGENISSIEIENVLYKHPDVAHVAVVGVPHEKWGETPCAFVELAQGSGNHGEEALIAYCREHLARFKVPRRIIFGALPKTATGKIQKFKLRQDARRILEQATAPIDALR